MQKYTLSLIMVLSISCYYTSTESAMITKSSMTEYASITALTYQQRQLSSVGGISPAYQSMQDGPRVSGCGVCLTGCCATAASCCITAVCSPCLLCGWLCSKCCCNGRSSVN